MIDRVNLTLVNLTREQEQRLATIDSQEFDLLRESPRMSVEIPRSLLRMFRNMSAEGIVRVGSFVYEDIGGLFPAHLPGEDGMG